MGTCSSDDGKTLPQTDRDRRGNSPDAARGGVAAILSDGKTCNKQIVTAEVIRQMPVVVALVDVALPRKGLYSRQVGPETDSLAEVACNEKSPQNALQPPLLW